MIQVSGSQVNNSSVREVERESIRRFLAEFADAGGFQGRRVLDYGCGKQPYRDLIEEAGGNYFGFDLAAFPGNVSGEDVGPAWARYARPIDVVVCTQVVQYVPDVPALLARLREILDAGGMLAITWPTAWAEVEPTDLHRFTEAGMRRLLDAAGFRVVTLERRAEIVMGGFRLALGYGAIAERIG